MDRKILIANDGMILTDGEIYGTKIYLAEDRNENDFYEISFEEYENLINEESEVDFY